MAYLLDDLGSNETAWLCAVPIEIQILHRKTVAFTIKLDLARHCFQSGSQELNLHWKCDIKSKLRQRLLQT